MCERCGKWTFPTWRGADEAASHQRKKGKRVAAYHCPHLKRGYHVGASRPRRVRRIH
jgi:hypothetical protein